MELVPLESALEVAAEALCKELAEEAGNNTDLVKAWMFNRRL